MLIYVKILTGQTFELNGMRALVVRYIPLKAEDDDTVLTIKAKLQERLDVTPNHQRLLYRGICLENDCPLKACNVQVGSVIQMEINYPMQIGVRTWENRNLNVNVFASDRVMVVKVMLEQQTRVPIHQQVLILASTVMQDDFTLQDYNVRNGEILLQMRNNEPSASPSIHLSSQSKVPFSWCFRQGCASVVCAASQPIFTAVGAAIAAVVAKENHSLSSSSRCRTSSNSWTHCNWFSLPLEFAGVRRVSIALICGRAGAVTPAARASGQILHGCWTAATADTHSSGSRPRLSAHLPMW